MSSTKVMLLGIAIMVVALFIQREPAIRIGGNEFFILLLGLFLTITGLFLKNKS